MAINLTAVRSELLPGLDSVSGKYDQLPKIWPRLYEKRKSNMQLERNVSMRYLSIARAKQDGQPVSFDNNPGERYTYNQQHTEFGLAFAMTAQTIEDNLYKQEFGPRVLGMMEAFQRAEETYGAAILNNATTYVGAVNGDGKALGATDHPVDSGTVSNIASPAASLNETSLLNAQVAINNNWRDNANQRMNAKPKLLIIPPGLEAVAVRLLKTELRPGTSNNDVNAILSVQGGIPEGYVVWNYLTSAYAWFLKTSEKGLLHYDRVAFETGMSVEFTTDNLLCKGRMRKSWGYFDWRSLYCSMATS